MSVRDDLTRVIHQATDDGLPPRMAEHLADAVLASGLVMPYDLTQATRMLRAVSAERDRLAARVAAVDKVLTTYRPDQRKRLTAWGEGYRAGYDRAAGIARGTIAALDADQAPPLCDCHNPPQRLDKHDDYGKEQP